MAIYTFRYTPWQTDPCPAFPSGIKTKRPILNVTVINGVSRVPFVAMVDSGADYVAFPTSVMTSLEIDSSAALPGNMVAVGAQPNSFFHSAEIEVEDFLRTNLNVGFTEGLNAWGIGILGQVGFFDHVKNVNFNFESDVFTIEI